MIRWLMNGIATFPEPDNIICMVALMAFLSVFQKSSDSRRA